MTLRMKRNAGHGSVNRFRSVKQDTFQAIASSCSRAIEKLERNRTLAVDSATAVYILIILDLKGSSTAGWRGKGNHLNNFLVRNLQVYAVDKRWPSTEIKNLKLPLRPRKPANNQVGSVLKRHLLSHDCDLSFSAPRHALVSAKRFPCYAGQPDGHEQGDNCGCGLNNGGNHQKAAHPKAYLEAQA